MKNEVKLTEKYFTEEERTVGDEFTPLKSIATRKMLWRKIEQLRKENEKLRSYNNNFQKENGELKQRLELEAKWTQ